MSSAENEMSSAPWQIYSLDGELERSFSMPGLKSEWNIGLICNYLDKTTNLDTATFFPQDTDIIHYNERGG